MTKGTKKKDMGREEKLGGIILVGRKRTPHCKSHIWGKTWRKLGSKLRRHEVQSEGVNVTTHWSISVIHREQGGFEVIARLCLLLWVLQRTTAGSQGQKKEDLIYIAGQLLLLCIKNTDRREQEPTMSRVLRCAGWTWEPSSIVPLVPRKIK